MKGTNTGAFHGLPATDQPVALPGVDVIEIGADGIKAETGYFDTRAIPEQLGLQVLIQPLRAGAFAFGNSIAVQSGKKTRPGAFGITTIWNSDAQTEDTRALSRATATEMLRMEGFIGVSIFRIGGRGVTISAWEKPEHTKQLMRGGTHAEAMRRFWSELGIPPSRASGFPITSIHCGSGAEAATRWWTMRSAREYAVAVSACPRLSPIFSGAS